MDRQNINSWLRAEAEKIDAERKKIEKEIVKKACEHRFDDINKLNIKMNRLQAQEIKLYEMIGRIDEIENI